MKDLNLTSPQDLIPDEIREEVKVLAEAIEIKFNKRSYKKKTTLSDDVYYIIKIQKDFVGSDDSIQLILHAYMSNDWTLVTCGGSENNSFDFNFYV